jgi:hypothetical protein
MSLTTNALWQFLDSQSPAGRPRADASSPQDAIPHDGEALDLPPGDAKPLIPIGPGDV